MRDALDTPRTWRAKVVDIIVGSTSRTSVVTGALATCLAAGGLAAIGNTTFGLFNNCAGTTEGTATAASTNYTSIENPWTPADVGRSIDIQGAGAAGAVHSTTIAAYVGPGQITLTNPAITSVVPTSSSASGCAIWGDAVVQILDRTPLQSADGLNNLQTGVAAVAGNASLVTASGSTAARSLANRAAERANVKNFGAVGDGVADDSTAVANADTYAKSLNIPVYFPPGQYAVPTLTTRSGRMMWVGEKGTVRIRGKVIYQDNTYPASADIANSLTFADKLIIIEGLDFDNAADYSLILQVQEDSKFMVTCRVFNCDFYGLNGVGCDNLIGYTFEKCRFFNKSIGSRFGGCTNGTLSDCYFHNLNAVGVDVGLTTLGAGNRLGGENMKLIGCEFAVCVYGIRADRHQWMALEGCLLDYCCVPLVTYGCRNLKAINSYFGASNTANRFSADTGYQAPASAGVAVFQNPQKVGAVYSPSSATYTNCEFVDYTNNNQPIVFLQGKPGGYAAGQYVENTKFTDCWFIATGNHTKSYLLTVTDSRLIKLKGNTFYAPSNNPTTIIAPYIFTTCSAVSLIDDDSTNVLNAALASIPCSDNISVDSDATNPLNIFVGGVANKKVQVGAADSGGAGFRLLRVPN